MLTDDIIEQIYGAMSEPDTWPGVIIGICAAFDGHSATLAFTDSSNAISELAVTRGLFEDSSVRGAYMAHYRSLDSAVPLFLDLEPCQAVITSETWSPGQLARNEFYNDFFLKLGLNDAIGANLFRDGRTASLICVQREAVAGPFATRARVRASLGIGYSGVIASGVQDHGVQARFTLRF